MKTLSRVALVLAAVVAVTVLWQGPASATGGPGGGGLGGTTCGQSYTPGCKITAGSPGSPGGPGSPGTGGTGGTHTVGSGPGSGCTGTVNATFGCVPAGLHDHGPDTGLPDRGWRPARRRGSPRAPAAGCAGPARRAVPAAS